MSDPVIPTFPNAPISNPRLRDLVAAVSDLARPVTIYACGFSVAAAVFLNNANVEVVVVAAGVATGVSYFRSRDKQAEIGAAKP